MRISFKEWAIFILIAILCLGLWYKFEYPRFTFVDLSVNKKEALNKAESYLKSKGIDTEKYLKAIVFDTDGWADRYLQKTIGVKSEDDFIKKYDYELFFWLIRFFKEFKKEEYIIRVSSKSGNILNFKHLIEDVEPREDIEKNVARQKAEEFLKNTYGLNLNDYDFHEEKIKRYDRRIDYAFSWEKKGVYIPWGNEEGGAKLLIGATVSGEELREFYKSRLDIPEKFQRYIENQFAIGEYLSSFAFLFLIFLLGWSMYIVNKGGHDLIIRLCKKLFVYLVIFLIIINIAHNFNNIQKIIIDYPTSINLSTFIFTYLVRIALSLMILTICFILPGLAGESLRHNVLPDNKYSSFLHYIKSSFYSRNMSARIILGYVLFLIFLGFQAVLFYFGHKYLGVWREWIKLTQLSSSYIPFLSAFVIASNASLSEEVIFRLFSISWAKKYLKNIIIAVILSAFIWGLGHSEYAIFPVWFRVIEVTMLGFLSGFIFIRYGLIALIVAHYLFDVFWGTAAYILGHSSVYLFAGSILILAIPLIFALITYFINKEDKEREVEIMLNPTEKYNLNILITFVSSKKSQGLSPEWIKKELMSHNWDISLVESAINEAFKSS